MMNFKRVRTATGYTAHIALALFHLFALAAGVMWVANTLNSTVFVAPTLMLTASVTAASIVLAILIDFVRGRL